MSKKINFKRLGKSALRIAEKCMPEVLLVIGIGGMITAGVMAVKATPIAEKCLAEEKKRARENHEGITEDEEKNVNAKNCSMAPAEIVKATWRCYLPAITTAGMSIVCIVGAHSINTKRRAALAAACKVTETTLKEYRDKVISTVGDEAEKEIIDAIAKDKVADNPPPQNVIIAGNGSIPCMDILSGQYFMSSVSELERIANILNRRMRDEMYISLNDFYYEVGLRQTKVGDEVGWNIDRGYIDLYFTSMITEDNRPCLVVNYQIPPNYNYQRLG